MGPRSGRKARGVRCGVVREGWERDAVVRGFDGLGAPARAGARGSPAQTSASSAFGNCSLGDAALVAIRSQLSIAEAHLF
jgi:hypothetical protein